ncbi:hypothetical protein D3C87_735970 [compost metagenome]
MQYWAISLQILSLGSLICRSGLDQVFQYFEKRIELKLYCCFCENYAFVCRNCLEVLNFNYSFNKFSKNNKRNFKIVKSIMFKFCNKLLIALNQNDSDKSYNYEKNITHFNVCKFFNCQCAKSGTGI